MYEQIKKNCVDAANQLKSNDYVKFHNQTGCGIRIMFVGNSITFHDVKESIGWVNACGMAASEESNDYVHLIMNKINQKSKDASYCVCQVSEWEKQYKNGENVFDMYKDAQKYDADIIVARFVENCPLDNFDSDLFKTKYSEFIDFLNASGKGKLIFTGGFWKHPGNLQIKKLAFERNCPYVELDDLGENDEMKALGLFSHNGVANHPGDKGMDAIAERILGKLTFI